jgi:CrcB protein
VTPFLVALGAAVGAPLRFWLVQRLDTDGVPRGTWLANVAGSTLLGLLLGLGVDGRPLALLGVGLCGAFTTYSTFAVQTVGLGSRRGAAYAVATVGASLAGCAVGFLVGGLVVGGQA